MATGMVEEISPLPLDQLSWGYVFDPAGKSKDQILYFAAPKEIVFADSKKDNWPKTIPVLPSLFAFQGLDFKTASWVFLREKEGITGFYIEPGFLFPTKIVSRFLVSQQENVNNYRDSDYIELRDKLENQLQQANPEANFTPGLIRIKDPQNKGKTGLTFQLEQLLPDEEKWKKWKRSESSSRDLLIAADLRDRDLTREARKKERGIKQIKISVATVLVLLGLFSLLELRHWQMIQRAGSLEATIEERSPLVERLEEIQDMTALVSALEEKVLQPFEWMVLINSHRPQQIHITTFSQETPELIRLSGIADEIALVNRFTDQMREDERFSSVSVSEVQTTREGVTFSMRITPGTARLFPADLEVPEVQIPIDETAEESEEEEEEEAT